ncbi:MAG: adenosylcobinamide-phosphate synthase CbiB [Deltaproteobacteria bacterium]|jgi:adenosylcobinamide-phosphate synthase|nr:adenosylcobinamide-phosphate synthase CbiB [Deltaproteobacteria bacterium]
MPALITAVAYVVDWLMGDPQTWPHPVRVIGALISRLEKLLRKTISRSGPPSDRALFWAGTLMALAAVSITGYLVWIFLHFSARMSQTLWYLIGLYFIYSLLCLRDLLDHTQRVEQALDCGDIPQARQALSWIVGRDTAQLNITDIRRAEIETLAENFSDGLVAPLFYLAVGGPVLAWMYKAINTLDSMVGYKNPTYLFFGRFSARIDDVLNYIPARLAALILISASRTVGGDYKNAWILWRKEGRFHSSPNSGQTEAAMAGALGVQLGGPGYYGGLFVDKPVIGSSGNPASAELVRKAERLIQVGSFLMLLSAMIIELILFHSCSRTPWGWGF